MKEMLLIVRKEWTAFLAGDRSALTVHGILVLSWSAILAVNLAQEAPESGGLWWIFFSVIVTSNFANSTFIAERLTGSLEVLLTCGLGRGTILAGKILFVLMMALGMGLLCLVLALIGLFLAAGVPGYTPALLSFNIIAYAAACLMNATCSAWLSTRLSNPRLSHFANLLLLGLVVGVHAAFRQLFAFAPWTLPAVLLLLAALFGYLATRAFFSDTVVQPVNL
jgi:ABC-type Na+ efflux pump permease subunit